MQTCRATVQRRLLPENDLNVGFLLIHPEFCNGLACELLGADDSFLKLVF